MPSPHAYLILTTTNTLEKIKLSKREPLASFPIILSSLLPQPPFLKMDEVPTLLIKAKLR